MLRRAGCSMRTLDTSPNGAAVHDGTAARPLRALPAGRIALLCLLVVLVLGATFAASAARAAQYGECLSQANGDYTNNSCTAKSAAPEGGTFEWEPLHKQEYSGKIGEATFSNEGGTITCKEGNETGVILDAKRSTATVTWLGCSAVGHPCQSLGAGKEGEIKTFQLESRLIGPGEKGVEGIQPGEGEAWVQTSNEGGEQAPWLAKQSCTGFGFYETSGLGDGAVTPVNSMTGSSKVAFNGGVPADFKVTFCSTESFTFGTCFYENLRTAFSFEDATKGTGAYEVRTVALAPTVRTGVATQVTQTGATLAATVNSNEETLGECKFEYGPTSEYGSSAPCKVEEGGEHVTAAVTGLKANTSYNFRISATDATGTSKGADRTFATLESVASANTKNKEEAAKATDGQLSATASGGTGTVVAGKYGSALGGAPLARGGDYVDVYLGTGNSFDKLEFKDCELGGGHSIWWQNSEGTWLPITSPTAVYSEGVPPCITVTITATSTPDLAEMTGTRFGTRHGTELGAVEYGRCAAKKGGFYAESGCLKPDLKKGVPKGKYEWYGETVGCFPQKKGEYTEGACQTKPTKAKKGTFERASAQFTDTSGVAKFEIASVGTLECNVDTSVGELTGPKTGTDTVTYEGCELLKNKCASSSAEPAGTIVTEKLTTFIENEPGGKAAEELYGEPFMTFTCGGERYVLNGWAQAAIAGDVNAKGAKSEVAFKPGSGEQELKIKDSHGTFTTTMTASELTTTAQELEIQTSPPPAG